MSFFRRPTAYGLRNDHFPPVVRGRSPAEKRTIFFSMIRLLESGAEFWIVITGEALTEVKKGPINRVLTARNMIIIVFLVGNASSAKGHSVTLP